MSEEANQPKEKHCCKKLLVLVILSLLISIGALVTSIYALVGNSSIGGSEKAVVISKQYDKGKSYDKAKESAKPMIIYFYTDWCGYSQKFVPFFHKLTKDREAKKLFSMVYVNCEKQENAKLMEEFKVQGFPSVYVVDKKGNHTHLDNQLFFAEDPVEAIKEAAEKFIEEKED